MELTEIVVAIIFSGLLIVIMLSIYFIYKNRRQRIKVNKRATADLKSEESALKETLPEDSINRSIEEITSGRYRVIKIYEGSYTKRDNTHHSFLGQPVAKNNQNLLSALLIKRTAKKFSRLKRIV